MASGNMPDSFTMPPGTVLLIGSDGEALQRELNLEPKASNDPNDPLNWSKGRKNLNFWLVLAVTAIIFTQLSIQTVFWQLFIIELPATYEQLTNSSAIGLTGTATGCIFLIPFAIKYGRRSIYIISTAVMAGMAIWSARMTTVAEVYVTNLIAGFAGATNEAIVQMTIADLFFVHQRGTANGLYMGMVMIGSFLSPIIAGQMATKYGWRTCYWALAAFNIAILVLFIFFYEESKYIPRLHGTASETLDANPEPEANDDLDKGKDDNPFEAVLQPSRTSQSHIDTNIPLLSYKERLRLVTKTDESLLHLFVQPLYVLFKFPVVMYTAIQYAFGLCWISVMGYTISIVFPYPPYGFSPAGIGNMSLGPFIGSLLGSIFGGVLADKLVLYLARRNHGYYEPEMRLHLNHLPIVCMTGGILMFGLTVAKGLHWILPSVGGALFGFGLGVISDGALSIVIDCYRGVTGEAFVAIAFLRNVFSVAISFATVPWMNAQGLQNMYIVIGVWAFVMASLYIPLIYYGKKIREKTAGPYYHLMELKGDTRM